MNAFVIASIVFGSLFGGTLLGMRLRAVLPPNHLSLEAKDSVRVAMASVATMSALVLGLLVASTKSAYDAKRYEVTQMAAKIDYLDRLLVNYGPVHPGQRRCRTQSRDCRRKTIRNAHTSPRLCNLPPILVRRAGYFTSRKRVRSPCPC